MNNHDSWKDAMCSSTKSKDEHLLARIKESLNAQPPAYICSICGKTIFAKFEETPDGKIERSVESASITGKGGKTILDHICPSCMRFYNDFRMLGYPLCFVKRKSLKSEIKFPVFGKGIPHFPKVT